MNLSFFIARRYILGKKSHNAINIVSAISIISVIVGASAFIIILSVFNGFDKLVQSMYDAFYPDIEITVARGKVFTLQDDTLSHIKNHEGIASVSEILEDNGLLKYNDRQTVGTVRGVSNTYHLVSGIDSLVYQGDYKLEENNQPLAIMGRGLAYHLNLNPDLYEPLKIYVPKRTARISMDPNKSLTLKYIMVNGVFSSQPDIDGKYTIAPIGFVRELFGYTNECSSIEIKLSAENRSDEVQSYLSELLGDDFIIKNRYQQNELLYKTMRTEKWAIFAILALVLTILLFSLVGSLSMLIIEKKKDINILHSLGASEKLIRRIFYREGVLITVVGTILGLIIGSTIVILQQKFGLLKLQGGFIIDAYPVDMQAADLVVVVITILTIGSLASWYPVRYLLRKAITLS